VARALPTRRHHATLLRLARLDAQTELFGLAVAELAAAVDVKDRAGDVPQACHDRLVECVGVEGRRDRCGTRHGGRRCETSSGWKFDADALSRSKVGN